MGVVPLTLQLKIKFPTKNGLVMVRADQKMARQCLVAAMNHEVKHKEQVGHEPL